MATKPIDRDKVRIFLDCAVDLLPKTKLNKLIEGYASPEQLRPDAGGAEDLLKSVGRFHAVSLRGDYYEEFMVNSMNLMSLATSSHLPALVCGPTI